jgi:3-hydroxy-9,10-secoandrosta-1,3,5(10)-triene-9,17-dione monooxygenase
MSLSSQAEVAAPEPDLSPEQMLGRARALVPVLRARQEEAERLRRLPDETSREFIDAGFYRLLQPRRFGGYEFDLTTFQRVSMELARGCPSSAWSYSLVAGHAHLLGATFPERCQAEVFGPAGDVRIPGRFRPGVARAEPDGIRVTGTWDYVSGSDSATHFVFGFTFGDDLSGGELATDVIAILDAADVEVIHNWDVVGMLGTGSNRCVVRDVFVPEHRVVPSFLSIDAAPGPGRQVHDAPIYRAGGVGTVLYSETASIAVGAARGVLDLYEENLRARKTSVLPLIPMLEHAQYPRFFGEAWQLIDVAEAALLRAGEEYTELAAQAAADGVLVARERDAPLMMRLQYCAKLAYDAVQLMMRTAGSAGMRGGAMWQRYMRDFMVLMTHNSLQPELSAEGTGRAQLGLLPHGSDVPVPQVR